ncbi:MAG: DeoR/GlpR family DNA-binding transcription regulator [Planctomycetota bacterium]
MLPKQREAEILSDLDRRGVVTVSDLADRLEVTGETIRRDLIKLEGLGRLVRTHGGAVAPSADTVESPFAVRKTDRAKEKRSIGSVAARSVGPGAVIAIDASTTCLEVARQLPALDAAETITVVSNGLDVVRWLSGRRGVEVICTGGEFDAAGACFVGPIAEATLRRFAFDRAFLSCRGYDDQRGASEASPAHAALKLQMLHQADAAWLLVDSSKIGTRSGCFFAEATAFTTIVSDKPPSADADSRAASRWRVAGPIDA